VLRNLMANHTEDPGSVSNGSGIAALLRLLDAERARVSAAAERLGQEATDAESWGEGVPPVAVREVLAVLSGEAAA
jgi:hypothetical protein